MRVRAIIPIASLESTSVDGKFGDDGVPRWDTQTGGRTHT